MSTQTKIIDEEFIDAGKVAGLTIWRIENFKCVKTQKKDHGTFFTGDSYLVLYTTIKNSGSYSWNIHYWLGKESTADEYGTCAIKAIELDDHLGGRPIQYREVQFHESDLFLSYFEKTGLRYLNGGFESGFTNIKDIEYAKKLYVVKGKKDIRMAQVPLSSDSLNKSDVFILDEGKRVYQWNPPGASRMEKLRAQIYSKRIRDDDHCGKSELIILDEDWDSNSEFWSLIKGDPSQIKHESDVSDEDFEKSFKLDVESSLYRVSDANSDEPTISLIKTGELKRDLLDSNDCFIIDGNSKGIFCWIGSQCTIAEKKSTVIGAKSLMEQKKYPNYIPLSSVIDGGETIAFKSLFSNWI